MCVAYQGLASDYVSPFGFNEFHMVELHLALPIRGGTRIGVI